MRKEVMAREKVMSIHDKIMTSGTKENLEFEKRRKELRMPTITVNPITPEYLNVRIVGSTPYIMHCFAGKVIRMMEEERMNNNKQVGNKKQHKPLNPVEQGLMSLNFPFLWDKPTFKQTGPKTGFATGIVGVPLVAIKSAIISVLQMQNKELYKQDLRRTMFIRGFEDLTHAPLEYDAKSGAIMHLDPVKVGPKKQADLRYRVYFYPWALSFQIEYLPEYWNPETLINAIHLTGYVNGIGDWRPQKTGNFGRFEIDRELTGKANLPKLIGKAKAQTIDLEAKAVG